MAASPRPPSPRFADLYELYGPIIYQRCRRILRDPVLAEDATQEVFLRALKHIETAPGGSAAVRWLSRIATNHCLNVLRDFQYEPEPMDVLPEQVDDTVTRRHEARALATRLLKELPPLLAEPVLLHFGMGYDHSEVAVRTGRSRRTVINRLNAARMHPAHQAVFAE